MTASSRATTARDARRHNERAILAALRRAGTASKPEVARQIALSPQAVNGIFEKLLQQGLIREGGRRAGAVGHPSTLYALCPDGAFAIGIDIGPRFLEAVLVDFTGAVAYRALTDFDRPDPATLRAAFAEGVAAVLAHVREAGIDRARIAGIGVAEPAFIAEPAATAGALEEAAAQWRGLSLDRVLPEFDGLPVHLHRGAAVGALAMAMQVEMPRIRDYLYLAIGDTVDSCLVLGGAPHGGAQGRAGRFAALPAPSGLTVGAVAGFAALRGRLTAAGSPAADLDDLYRAMNEQPKLVAAWSRAAADAVLAGVQAVQACLDLEAVVLQVDPPNAFGDRIEARLRDGLARLPSLGLAVPAIRRLKPQPGSLAGAAAAVALHERFAPRLDRLTRQGPEGGGAQSGGPPSAPSRGGRT
ncbi:ROK family transcriptional regulator [Marinibaculum pumilum]|uniref:ROK family transcriptional regulator n=1 Tax=Marinibaculum pumilum TaxID=1766165 RepID=A0ABV7KZG0_9PROT